MSDNKLSTDPYKGVRDFYPEDAAIQQYIFNTWKKTAESFGYERIDASILEPSDLYRAKGAENEEMVNEQTYTFTDRGEREVTLRPEMTPTVARMVAAKQRELAFPLRWYSIPNLFRYERPQRGRLREHWQLNCDIFGANDTAADVEMIALAYQALIDLGAKPDMFEILINNRQEMTALYNKIGLSDQDTITAITRLNDRKQKMSDEDYRAELMRIVISEQEANAVIKLISNDSGDSPVKEGLKELGIKNVRIDRTLARGFDYYTGTVFEIFDTNDENNRALGGGGRYDNLTSMFGGEPVPGVGFGMGDVALRDFLETHELLPEHSKTTSAMIAIIPVSANESLYAEKVAAQIRQTGLSVTTDIGTQKPEKKKARAQERGSTFIIEIGEEQVKTENITLKNLKKGSEKTCHISDLLNYLGPVK